MTNFERLGIITRWILGVLLVFLVFKEQPGTGTRLFVVFTSISVELMTLRMNLENIQERNVQAMVKVLQEGAAIRAAKKK